MPAKHSKLHYFGASEEEYFHKVADRRTQFVRPLAMFFVHRNVRSDTLTLASFLLLAFFFFPLFGLENYLAAWVILIISILLDGFDGPVARLGRYASDKGALLDIMNDITAMVIVGLTAIHFGHAVPLLGGLYIVTYLYMIVLIIARNVMEQPFRFVFKSKYYLFIFLLIKVHFHIDILNWFLLVFSVYQIGVTIQGMVHLRRTLPGVLGAGTRTAWPGTDVLARREKQLSRRTERRIRIREHIQRLRGRL
ncbi:MAG: CDP-alcohol phosphatidyltransferase family protein [Candidatus Lernaella stagnicola]|nr:CDP-alcohol phosphatidyltransferase family protein [Candidatus Lernaella stagnicola]